MNLDNGVKHEGKNCLDIFNFIIVIMNLIIHVLT